MAFKEYDHTDFDRARELQASIGIHDLHLDSILQQRLIRYDIRKRHRRPFRAQWFIWHADLPRMAEAGYGGACMGIHYWPWESERGWREANVQMDYLDKVAEADHSAMRVWGPEDWEKARESGRIGLAPGMEGAHLIGGDLSRVEAAASRAVAYMTLTHFNRNSAATPSIGRGANERDGLTGFGRELVAELNRWGIAIDCAHVNTPGVLEICKLTEAPVFCTHTGLKTVKKHKRNITDEELDAIAATGGTVGVMFSRQFLAPRMLGARSEAIADHIDHIVQRVGVEHASIGSDYDGWIPLFTDQRDCLDIVRVTHILLERGYTPAQLTLILRDNAIRVHKAVRAARKSVPTTGATP